MDNLSKLILEHSGSNKIEIAGSIHKYARSKIISQFGFEIIKEKLLPQIEEMVHKTLTNWSSSIAPVEVKQSSAIMVFNFTVKQILSFDYENPSENLSEYVINFVQVLKAVPLNIPGTTFYKCLKAKKKIMNMIRDKLKEKVLKGSETNEINFLDKTMKDLNTEKFLTEDFIVLLTFGSLLASYETISSSLALAFKFLYENPQVVEQLKVEHESILKNRKTLDSSLTWEEYKSMTYTFQVINETLRLANTTPGLLRKALKDIHVNGYTIPAGWAILVVTSSLHLNPKIFKDPLTFNPSRWQDIDSSVMSKNFMPFGRGMRHCPGSEFTKAFMATFLHVLVTKHRWTKIKGGDIARIPILAFRDGIHVKVMGKHE